MGIKSVAKWFYLEKFATIHYQIILILLSTLFFLKLFHEKATGFTSTDPKPEFMILTPEAVKKSLDSSVGQKVEAGIHIENFQKFEMRKGEFVIDTIVWFRFNPAVISLETVGKFSFEKGQILKKSKPKSKLINGIILARYNVRLQFTTNLSFKLFPFNDHRIYISLINKKLSPGELVFESYESDLSLSKNIIITGWKHTNSSVETGYTEALLDRHDPTTKVFYPVAIFAIDFSRVGTRQPLIMLLPLFVILYMAFISLIFPFAFYEIRLKFSTANIAALLGYRFVIENMSPKVGYSMLTDYIFNLFLFLAFIIYLLNMTMRKKGLIKVRGAALLILHIMAVSSIYYLVRYWMKV